MDDDPPMTRGLDLGLSPGYSPGDRERWIAEAAYYRAEKRGFKPGFALEDWLAGEALIDYELSHGAAADKSGAKSSGLNH